MVATGGGRLPSDDTRAKLAWAVEGLTMSIREVLERRRRLISVVQGIAFLALMLGVYVGANRGIPWLRYAAVGLFFATVPLYQYGLKCPRCRGSIGLAREKPRKIFPPFAPGELCPHCGVSLEEPWNRPA